jgi:hypothetical protein
MLQDNTASTDVDVIEIAPVPGYQLWCPKCYVDSTERLIAGFTIEHNRPGFEARIVPPLSPGAAASLRAARDQILLRRAGYPSAGSEHPRHAGAR